jgi:hypothetical protein
MHALGHAQFVLIQRGAYGNAQEISEKFSNLADQKGSATWKSFAASNEGCLAAWCAAVAERNLGTFDQIVAIATRALRTGQWHGIEIVSNNLLASAIPPSGTCNVRPRPLNA